MVNRAVLEKHGDAVEKIGESLERSSLSTAAAMEKVGESMEKSSFNISIRY